MALEGRRTVGGKHEIILNERLDATWIQGLSMQRALRIYHLLHASLIVRADYTKDLENNSCCIASMPNTRPTPGLLQYAEHSVYHLHTAEAEWGACNVKSHEATRCAETNFLWGCFSLFFKLIWKYTVPLRQQSQRIHNMRHHEIMHM